jgi:hypothetical protein
MNMSISTSINKPPQLNLKKRTTTWQGGMRTNVRHSSHRMVLVSMIGPIDRTVQKVLRVPFMLQRQSVTTRSKFEVPR